MFTDCPSCERLFRIRAAHLKAADGWVRCGYCAETFYALDRLYDAPVKTPELALPPEVAAPGLPASGAEAEPDKEQAAQQQEQPVPKDTGGEQLAVPERQIHGQDEVASGEQDDTDDTAAEVAQGRTASDDLPPVLASDDDGTARSYSRYIWSGLVVILLLVTRWHSLPGSTGTGCCVSTRN